MKLPLVALLIIPALASAECHLNTPNAIVCLGPLNAARAYIEYGTDSTRTNLPYNRDILRQAGCGRPYGTTYSTVGVTSMSHSQVPTPNGYVGVTAAVIGSSDVYYVADGYLSGTCARYQPQTFNAPPAK